MRQRRRKRKDGSTAQRVRVVSHESLVGSSIKTWVTNNPGKFVTRKELLLTLAKYTQATQKRNPSAWPEIVKWVRKLLRIEDKPAKPPVIHGIPAGARKGDVVKLGAK